MEKLVLSVPEMARQLGISRCQAYHLVRQEGFPSARLGKRIVVPIDGLKAFLARGGDAALARPHSPVKPSI